MEASAAPSSRRWPVGAKVAACDISAEALEDGRESDGRVSPYAFD